MRKRDWIEIKVGVKRPVRTISHITVNEVRLMGYGWEGGAHVGVLPYADGYVRFASPSGGWIFLKLPEMRHGQIVEITGELACKVRDGESGLFN